MTRKRLLCLGLLLVLAIVPIACQTVVVDTPTVSGQQVSSVPITASQPAAVQAAAGNEVTCKMFILGDLAEDATYAKWIVDTIPTMIQPGTWDQKKGTPENRSLSYFAPGKVLVVYHTAAVQAKVDEFLKGLKHASAQVTKPAPSTPTVQQAQFVPGGSPAPAPGYPVAAPAQQPKHLFHFIIRYEGEGILDANVVNFAKAIQAAGNGDLGLFKVNQSSSDAVLNLGGGSSPAPLCQVPPFQPQGNIQPIPQSYPPAPYGPIQKAPRERTEPAPSQPAPPPAASQPATQAVPPTPPTPSRKMPSADSTVSY